MAKINIEPGYEDYDVKQIFNPTMLQERLINLRNAIRKHRDYRGDDRCWMDDEELYAILPEGYTVAKKGEMVELNNCRQFIACRYNPGRQYVSPQRRIEELEAQVRSLEDQVKKLTKNYGGD